LEALYIIGTERHESRRIDTSLESFQEDRETQGYLKFYLSLDDNLTPYLCGEKIRPL